MTSSPPSKAGNGVEALAGPPPKGSTPYAPDERGLDFYPSIRAIRVLKA